LHDIGVGDTAFGNCTSLTSLTIPDSVISMGDGAFQWCISLTNVTIGNSVTNIGSSAFNLCFKLTTISVETSNPAYSSVSGVLFDKNQTTSSDIRRAKSVPIRSPTALSALGTVRSITAPL
jgi:hypothetical protein